MENCAIFGACRYFFSQNNVLIIQTVLIALGAFLGILLMWKPRKVIDIQIAMYRPFNWELKPISMEREVKNTRIMGIELLIIAVCAAILVIVQM